MKLITRKQAMESTEKCRIIEAEKIAKKFTPQQEEAWNDVKNKINATILEGNSELQIFVAEGDYLLDDLNSIMFLLEKLNFETDFCPKKTCFYISWS